MHQPARQTGRPVQPGLGDPKDRVHCDLCGSSASAVRCDKCGGQAFCLSCDDMYHRHPKRSAHVRKAVDSVQRPFRPPLPPKSELHTPPVPPPRRNKRFGLFGKKDQSPALPRKENGSGMMGSLKRFMGVRPLPPPPTQTGGLSSVWEEAPTLPSSNGRARMQRSPSRCSADSGRPPSDDVSPALPATVADINSGERRSRHHPDRADDDGRQRSQSMSGHVSPQPWMYPQQHQQQQHDMPPGFVTTRRGQSYRGWPQLMAAGSMCDMGSMVPPVHHHHMPLGFVPHMMQAQSMAQLSCPSCHGAGGIWCPAEPAEPGLARYPSNSSLTAGYPAGGAFVSSRDLRHPSPAPSGRSAGRPTPRSRRLARSHMELSRYESESENYVSGAETDDESDRADEMAPARALTPTGVWHCQHCTFQNSAGTRVCAMCCRTQPQPPPLPPPSAQQQQQQQRQQKKRRRRRFLRGSMPPGSPAPSALGRRRDSSPGCAQSHRRDPSPGGSSRGRDPSPSGLSRSREPSSSELTDSMSGMKIGAVTGERRASDATRRHSPADAAAGVTSSVTLPLAAASEAVVESVAGCPAQGSVQHASPKQTQSTGTSPPPQTIATQTNDELGPAEIYNSRTSLPRSGSHTSLAADYEPFRYSSRQPPNLKRTQSFQAFGRRERDDGAEPWFSAGVLWSRYQDRSSSKSSVHSTASDSRAFAAYTSGASSRGDSPARLSATADMSRQHSYGGDTGRKPADGADYLVGLEELMMQRKSDAASGQGMELVLMLRDAEKHNFSPDDLQVALNHCGSRPPVAWLLDNLDSMIETVCTLATNYGHERQHNDVGTISNTEARDALRLHKGNVWTAVTECVEQRRKKYAQLTSRGTFSREDIVTALTANHGNVEAAYLDLNRTQLKPFLMRIWGPPQGIETTEGAPLRPEVVPASAPAPAQQEKVCSPPPPTVLATSKTDNESSKSRDYTTPPQSPVPSRVRRDINTQNLPSYQNVPEVNVTPSPLSSPTNPSTHTPLGIFSTASPCAPPTVATASASIPATPEATRVEERAQIASSLQAEPEAPSCSADDESGPTVSGAEHAPQAFRPHQPPRLATPAGSGVATRENPSAATAAQTSSAHRFCEVGEPPANSSAVVNLGLGSPTQVATTSAGEAAVPSDHCRTTGTSSTGTSPTGTSPTGTSPTGTSPTGTSPTGTSPKNASVSVAPATTSSVPCSPSLLPVHPSSSSSTKLPPARTSAVSPSPVNAIQPQTASPETSVVTSESSSDSSSTTLSQTSLMMAPMPKQASGTLDIPIVSPQANTAEAHQSTLTFTAVTQVASQNDARQASNIYSASSTPKPTVAPSQTGVTERPASPRPGTSSSGSRTKRPTGNATAEISKQQMHRTARHVRTPPHYENFTVDSHNVDDDQTPTDTALVVSDSSRRTRSVTPDNVPRTVRQVAPAAVSPNATTTAELYSAPLRRSTAEKSHTTLTRPKSLAVEQSKSETATAGQSDPGLQAVTTQTVTDPEPKHEEANAGISSPTAGYQLGGDEEVSDDATSVQKTSEGNSEGVILHQEASAAGGRPLTPTQRLELAKRVIGKHVLRQRAGHATPSTSPAQSQDQAEGAVGQDHFAGEDIPHADDSADGADVYGAAGQPRELRHLTDDDVTDDVATRRRSHDSGGSAGSVGTRGDNVVSTSSDSLSEGYEAVMSVRFQPGGTASAGSPRPQLAASSSAESLTCSYEPVTVVHTHARQRSPHEVAATANSEATTSTNAAAADSGWLLTDTPGQDATPEAAGHVTHPHPADVVPQTSSDAEGSFSSSVSGDGERESLSPQTTDGAEAAAWSGPAARSADCLQAGSDQAWSDQAGSDQAGSGKAGSGGSGVSDDDDSSEANSAPPARPSDVAVAALKEDLKYGSATLLKRVGSDRQRVQRRASRLLRSGRARSQVEAEMASELMALHFPPTDSLQAASECSSLYTAITFLHQECELCAGRFSAKEMVSMTHCTHRCCHECAQTYFTQRIKERPLADLRCPFCNEPDLGSDDIASDYFSHLDIMLKSIVSEEVHSLFHKKLFERAMMKDPNFKWCPKCSSGFIAAPRQKKLHCPDCRTISCALCAKAWSDQHEGVSCEVFAMWRQQNDPEYQSVGLERHLAENGISCPSCHFRYSLAKGGCMHFTCSQCKYEFCSGCGRPFSLGSRCSQTDYCARLGLHAHHPRNCLFYLRDKEPAQLQQLLKTGGIEYNTEPPSGTEVYGEVVRRCRVQEQKETAEGLRDDLCGRTVTQGHAGLCRMHYVEYLSGLAWKHHLDPVAISDTSDLRQEMRRHGKRVRIQRVRESDERYTVALRKMVEVEIPLDP